MYDPLLLCDIYEEVELPSGTTRLVWQAKPSRVVVATVARIVDVISRGETPQELVYPARYYDGEPPALGDRAVQAISRVNAAKEIPPQAWQDALRPRTEFPDEPEDQRVIDRGRAITAAMGWFTHAMRLQAENFLAAGVLTRDDDFKI